MHLVVIGKDTRLSGYKDRAGPGRRLHQRRHGRAYLGPLPTPGVAMMTLLDARRLPG